MRILLACAQFPPTVSGYAQVAGHLAEGFSQGGHRVEVLTEGRGCYRKGRVVWLDASGRSMLDAGADIVQIIGPSPAFTEQVARRAERRGLPVVYYIHAFAGLQTYRSGAVPRIVDGLYARTVYRRALRGVTRAVSSTNDFAHGFQDYPGPWTVIPNGVDDPCIRQGVILGNCAPRPDPADLEILFVGQLRPYKGVEYLLRALKQVQGGPKHVRLTIVGEGPERGRLESLAQELDLGPSVSFRGSLTAVDLHAQYLTHDALVLPSVGGESFGIVLLEARLHGLTIIASELPGVREVVRAVGGTLTRPGDPNSIASALAGLTPIPASRRTLDRGILERYTWPVITTQYLELYRNITGPHG